MAKYRFQGALNAADFPFVSSFQSRTVINPQLDNNVKTNQAFYGTQESANYGIPQLLYCENVVPTAEGLMTVAYETVLPGIDGASDFDQAITIRDENENNFLFVPAGGKNYIYRANDGVWASKNPISAAGRTVSRAYVNGRTFICYENIGLFEYNSATDTFAAVPVTGLTATDIRGVGSSNNYLLVYTDIVVYWSSLIDPTDFVPSLTTGAGFSIPQDVKAIITAIIGTSGGFIIYTEKNTVSAVYSQNKQAPFIFKEVGNAGGIDSPEQVTTDQNSGPQYAFTTGGLQKITTQSSDILSGALNDFLAGKIWEYWEPTSKSLISVAGVSSQFAVKVAYIGSRYLVISYDPAGAGFFSYALFYDAALQRWGKLKIDHVDCFNYPYPNVFGDLAYEDLENISYEQLGDTSYEGLATGLKSTQPSKRTVAFLLPTGEVKILVMDYSQENSAGVAIFGKFQLTRARVMTIQQLELEATFGPEQPTVTAIAATDGKDLAVASPMSLLRDGSKVKRYAKRLTGINVSVAIEGSFAASTYLLEVTNDGDR